MARRSLRRRTPAAEYLLGYVEDDEPLENIMKKFKQLEEYQESTGREELTPEDCNTLIETTSIGSITGAFRTRYRALSPSKSSSSSEGETTRPAKYVDPVTQSYQQIQPEQGQGQVVFENVYSLSLKRQFQAVLVNSESGMSLRNKQKLKWLKGIVRKGLLFVWTHKREIKEWVEVLEKFKFQYIENLVWVKVNRQVVEDAGGLNSLQDFSGDFLQRKEHWPLPVSHLTLLMFKRIPTEKLELRHQRTCDVVFDFDKPQNYVYQMIETLLPEAGLKLELFANEENSRTGWMHVIHRDN